MYCGNCGKELADQAQSCMNCGREVGSNNTSGRGNAEQKKDKPAEHNKKWVALAIICGTIFLIMMVLNLFPESKKELSSDNQVKNKQPIVDYNAQPESGPDNSDAYNNKGVAETDNLAKQSQEESIADIDKDQQIVNACKQMSGDSYMVLEKCIQLEERAKANLAKMYVSEPVLNQCKQISGDSYMVLEKCIKMEQNAKSRLGY